MLSIPKNTLKALSLFAANKKDMRDYLRSVCVQQKEDHALIIATNGAALMIVNVPGVYGTIKESIIPIESIKTVLAWKTGKYQDDSVLFSLDDCSMLNRDQSQIVKYTQIDATYPDFSHVIPGALSGEMAFYDAELISMAADAVALATVKAKGPVKIRYNGTGPAIIDCNDDDILILIMPIREEANWQEYKRPAWLDSNPVAMAKAA